ncbi:MAG TPA: hypothetical protein VHV47_01750 [Opitutaceae bacterium]|jgi:hypothetical protein|nr:hypothetical protein [Opitutaceae bacterium]
MPRSRLSPILPIAILALAAGAGWISHRRARAIHEALTAALRRQSEETQRFQALKGRLKEAEDRHRRQAALLAGGSRPAIPPAPAQRRRTISERLNEDPAYQLAFLTTQRAETARRYRAFFRQTSLSPDKIARFEDLRARQQADQLDLQAIERIQGASAETAQALKKMNDDLSAAEKDLLGPSDFGQLEAFERTLPSRDLVDLYAGGAVTAVGQPFTPEEGERLVMVFAAASSSYRNGGQADLPTIDWNQVETQAQAFLTPAQLQLIATMEPPGFVEARYEDQVYIQAAAAREKDAAGASRPTPPAAGNPAGTRSPASSPAPDGPAAGGAIRGP